jgi:glycosyltransferase involved in cell wall biosynthesis
LLSVPSKIQEAFGLVICESMYCNTPVITSKSGAQEEIITNGEDGLLLDTVTDMTIADAIAYLMDNPAEYKKIREKGYHRVESTFTIENMVASIKSL